jgi:hypothetical protein
MTFLTVGEKWPQLHAHRRSCLEKLFDADELNEDAAELDHEWVKVNAKILELDGCEFTRPKNKCRAH